MRRTKLVRAFAAIALAVLAVPVVTPTGQLASGVIAPHSVQARHSGLPQPAGGSSTPISPEFWGLNIGPTHPFNATDALLVNATPIQYLRFGGGNYAEQFNYTTGVITLDSGTTQVAVTTVADFVSSCTLIHCKAILELPAEINSTSTVRYDVNYVVQTLGFQPAYWEIGNAPATWKHFNAPWSTWTNGTSGNITPVPFANEVHSLIGAIRSVDPITPIVALGSGMVPPYDQSWISALLRIDGPLLAGISVHDYPGWTGNASSTLTDFYAALNATWAIPNLISADVSFIRSVCANCSTQLFVSEANANYGGGTFDGYLSSFNDTVFLAAEVAQGLRSGAPNIDWFDFQSYYQGTFVPPGGSPGPNYRLFADLLPKLGGSVPSAQLPVQHGLYSVATTGAAGESLLLVNTNLTSSLGVSLTAAGFAPNGNVTVYSWAGHPSGPTSQIVPSNAVLSIPPLTVVVVANLTTGGSGGTPPKYPVTFAESGLPAGTLWNASVAGVAQSTRTSAISFLEGNGTFAYSIGPVAGFSASPSSGAFGVNGGALTVPVTFRSVSGPPPVSATFAAVPASVVLGGTIAFTVSASGGTAPYTYAYAQLPPGCVPANVASFSCAPSQTGNFTVRVMVRDAGQSQVNEWTNVSVTASASPPPPGGNSSASPFLGIAAPSLPLLVLLLAESALAILGAGLIARRRRQR